MQQTVSGMTGLRHSPSLGSSSNRWIERRLLPHLASAHSSSMQQVLPYPAHFA
jgi:hypothetical protein